jgi:hypothetical protein
MRMLRAAGLVLGLGVLAGCAATPAAEELGSRPAAPPDQIALQREAASCDARYPVARGTFAANVRCNNAAVEPLVARNPDRDLVRAFQAAGLEIAERVDRGEMNLEQADRALALALADYDAQLDARGTRSVTATLASVCRGGARCGGP